jgi:general secretion pathway protein E
VRRVCPSCAQPYRPAEDELRSFGVDPKSQRAASAIFLKGAGCAACEESGYKGRFSIQEILIMDDHLRNLVLARTPSNKIRQEAMTRGFVTMRQDAAEKVMQGITTFEEAAKRVFIDDINNDPVI